MCPQGTKSVSLFWSEQTMHSSSRMSSSSGLLIRDCCVISSPRIRFCIWLLGAFSFWHFDRALTRFGSGHRSSGVWFFLFFRLRSAPLAARKHAMDAEDFLSAPWLPREIRS
jgi:hypothetical protein